MKNIMLLIFMTIIAFSAKAGTCTGVTRTNPAAAPGDTITAARYNQDWTDLETGIEAHDGGCITDGTLEKTALNGTDFAAAIESVRQGCSLNYTDSNTLTISQCRLNVNGSWVNKTTSTSLTWGCSGCAAEASATQYYVYAVDGSSGSTLNVKISTTAPENLDSSGIKAGFGEDGSNNMIIGKFYNNASNDIVEAQVYSFMESQFVQNKLGATAQSSYDDAGMTWDTCDADPDLSGVTNASNSLYQIYDAGSEMRIKALQKILVNAHAWGSLSGNINSGVFTWKLNGSTVVGWGIGRNNAADTITGSEVSVSLVLNTDDYLTVCENSAGSLSGGMTVSAIQAL